MSFLMLLCNHNAKAWPETKKAHEKRRKQQTKYINETYSELILVIKYGMWKH